MYETYVTVQGRLVADPEVKHAKGSGEAFTVFRVAQSERRPVRGEPGRWADSETSYYDVTAFRGVGENAARCLRKGHPVIVTGKQRVRGFQREDGSTGSRTEIEAHALGHDLRWGVTAFTRNGDLPPADPMTGGGGDAVDGGFGDPEHDPYVVRQDLDLPEPALATADSGPLVRAGEEAAA